MTWKVTFSMKNMENLKCHTATGYSCSFRYFLFDILSWLIWKRFVIWNFCNFRLSSSCWNSVIAYNNILIWKIKINQLFAQWKLNLAGQSSFASLKACKHTIKSKLRRWAYVYSCYSLKFSVWCFNLDQVRSCWKQTAAYWEALHRLRLLPPILIHGTLVQMRDLQSKNRHRNTVKCSLQPTWNQSVNAITAMLTH